MKAGKRLSQSSVISPSRWTAYAAAGAASAFAGVSSAGADVHYSGIINQPVENTQVKLPLEDGAFLTFIQFDGEAAIHLRQAGESVGAFAATYLRYAGVYVYNLARGVNLVTQNFKNSCTRTSTSSQTFCYGVYIGGPTGNGYFKQRGVGAIGFDFNRGAGVQFGWARIKTTGDPLYRVIVVDYAWADPNEKLRVGQKQARPTAEALPAKGSLGLLALGAVGLMAWRRSKGNPASR
jgi:hypothetical protein